MFENKVILFETKSAEDIFNINVSISNIRNTSNFPPIYLVAISEKKILLFNYTECSEHDKRIHYTTMGSNLIGSPLEDCNFIQYNPLGQENKWKCGDEIVDDAEYHLPVVKLKNTSKVVSYFEEDQIMRIYKNKEKPVEEIISFDSLLGLKMYLDFIHSTCKIIYKYLTDMPREIYFSLINLDNSNKLELLITYQHKENDNHKQDNTIISIKKTSLEDVFKGRLGVPL